MKPFKSHTAQLIKRSCKRFTAAVLVLLLIVMFIPSAIALGNDSPVLPDEDIPETLTRAQLEAHGAVARLRSEEPDEFTFVYLNEDGTRTSYSYGVAVKYEENGEYKDKNNTIKDFNSEYGNTASDVELRFPKNLNKISVKYKNHNVKIKPVTDAKVSASVNGNTVTYYGAFGLGMDLRYASTMSGMKEDIILQSYQGVNSFSFEVDTDGLELKQINGQYVIADGETVVFSFGDLEVTDSFTGEDEATDNWDEHMTYAQGAIQTVKANKEYIFTITVDEEFLTADTTVYPVNIDPTFNITSNYIQDTYICEGSPAANFGSAAQMKIGYGASTRRNRILVNFSSFVGDESRPGLHHTTINSAYYNMYCTTTYTSQPYVDAYMVALNATQWTDTGATWNNAYSSTSTNAVLSGSSTVGTAGWYTFNITSAYTTWWQAFQYKGLMFRMRNEGSSPNYYRHFSSVNVANSAQLPYLTVNYGTVGGSIHFEETSGYLEIGDRLTLICNTLLQDAEIIWTSSDTSVATATGGRVGNVYAVGAGYATITARSAHDPNAVDTYELQVITVPVTGIELNYTTAYVAKGKTLTATATVSPSNASAKIVNWTSSNLSVATVSQNGVITAKAPGTVTITATTDQGEKTDTMTVIVPEFEDGEYYIQNKATKYYMDVVNSSTTVGTNIQQEYFDAANSQVWIFALQLNGYYTIVSKNSNFAASVSGTSTQNGATVVQSPYGGAAEQQWKVELLSSGAYKIVPKSGEASGMALAVASNSKSGGIDIQQKLYAADTNYTDEWIIDELLDDFTLMYIGDWDNDADMVEVLNNVNTFNYKGDKYNLIDKNTALREISSTKVFSCLTHGTVNSITVNNNENMYLEDVNVLSDNAFDNTMLAVLGACETGAYDALYTSSNFADTLNSKGVSIVISFNIKVHIPETCYWMEAFMNCIFQGYTVEQALAVADEDIYRRYVFDETMVGDEDYIVPTEEEKIARYAALTTTSAYRYILNEYEDLNVAIFED